MLLLLIKKVCAANKFLLTKLTLKRQFGFLWNKTMAFIRPSREGFNLLPTENSHMVIVYSYLDSAYYIAYGSNSYTSDIQDSFELTRPHMTIGYLV